MDIMEITDIHYWGSLFQPRLALYFVIGGVYGGLLGAGFALKQWWIPTILILLPAVLAVTSLFMNPISNVTYRLFFLAVPALAVIGFAIWLARTR